VIGRDTRESGPGLEAALVEGIVSAGGVARTAGVIPTPGVAVLARLSGAALGCVISASHNPYRDNGIKFIGGDGRKLSDDREAEIEAAMDDDGDERDGGRAETIPGAVAEYATWLICERLDFPSSLPGSFPRPPFITTVSPERRSRCCATVFQSIREMSW